jgi:hypothetical protein
LHRRSYGLLDGTLLDGRRRRWGDRYWSEIWNVRVQRSNEPPALGTRPVDDLLPLVISQLHGRKHRGRHRDDVCREGKDKLHRKPGPGNRSRRRGADLRIDDDSFAPDFEQGQLCRWRREVVGPCEQLDQLAPADSAVVRIAGWLRQHCVQAIVETHRGIRFLQDRSIPDLVVRAPTEGGGA